MIDKGNYDDESEAFNAINAVNERLINGANFEDLVKESDSFREMIHLELM